MATIAGPSSSRPSASPFHFFTSLPLELRDQIWRDALPTYVGPHLFPYEKGHWSPFHLTKGHRDYDADNDELNWDFRWHHDSLCTYFKNPLFFVSREARRVALNWMCKHGIDTSMVQDADGKQHRVFERGWNPSSDALYVPLELWNDFLDEPWERFWQPDMDGRNYSISGGIWHLAVPETLLSTSGINDNILALFDYYGETKTLYVVVGPQPDLDATGSHGDSQPQRWEMEDAKMGAYIYNHELGKFGFIHGEDRCHESLYELMEDIATTIAADFREANNSSRRIFEIRPVFAIKY